MWMRSCENSKYFNYWCFSDWMWWNYNSFDIVSTKKTYTIATNISCTASIKRDCNILHRALLVMILILMISICYYYAKQNSAI